MLIVSSASDVRKQVELCKAEGKTVGFVPTMGALHQGHLSLIRQSTESCDVTIASIFVNPTQFNDKEDLKRYPRMPEADAAMLEREGCNIVFMPTEQEVYPTPDTRVFEFGQLDKVMEGAFRPGHFNGVAQVVSRLFDIVRPDKAFFGLKDFQQLAVIKQMVRQLRLNISIVPCEIVREPDGLAMSSRNMLLNPQQRAAAPAIYRVLKQAKEKMTELSPVQLAAYATTQINADKELDVEYVEIVNADTLQPVTEWSNAPEVQLCVAVKVGKIRLIDNIKLK